MTSFHSHSKDDLSDSIIFSFDARWLEPLRTGQISLFFRRKIPTKNSPRFVYFYIGAPESAVVARAHVSRIEKVSPELALSYAEHGAISKNELRGYIGDRDNIGIISFDNIAIFSERISLDKLNRLGTFHPPQTFFYMSKWGAETINELGGAK